MDPKVLEWREAHPIQQNACGRKGAAVPDEAELGPVTDPKDNPYGRRYREMCGVLRWVEQCSRPDISAVLSELCKVQLCPGEKHAEMLDHLLKYLFTTQDAGIMFGRRVGEHPYGPVVGYVVSDWAGDGETFATRGGWVFQSWGGTARDRKSTSGGGGC